MTFTCDHVRETIREISSGSSERNELQTVQVQGDLLGDGEHLLPYVVCQACAILGGVGAGDVFLLEEYGDEHVRVRNSWKPYCETCVGDWLRESA